MKSHGCAQQLTFRRFRWKGMGISHTARNKPEHAAEKLAGAHRSYASSRPTNTQREVAEFVPATKRPSQTGIEQRELAVRDESAIGTANADHSAKHLGCGCWGIALGHRVTSGDPRNAILSESRFSQPM